MKTSILLYKTLLLLLPVQLSYHLWPTWSFVYGIRVDYLSPTIYLTDIVIGLLFASVLIDKNLRAITFKILKNKKLQVSLLFLFLYLILQVSLSPFPLLSLFRSIKIIEILLVIFFTYFLSPFSLRSVVSLLSVGVIWSSILSLFQVLNDGSVGGPLYLLGERSFRMSYPGIARAYYFGEEHLRAYGTFPHPNALSGFAGVTILLLFITKQKRLLKWIAIFSSLLILILTVSQNAWLSLILTLPFFVFAFRRKFVPLLVPLLVIISLFSLFESSELLRKNFVSDESTIQRLELLAMSGVYISGYPVLGIKPGNFIPLLPDVREFTSNFLDREFSWWLQPVHNIYILLLVETGFIGLFAFSLYLQKLLLLVRQSKLTIPLIFILFTGLWDHYWFTLHQSSLLFAIVVGLVIKDVTIHQDERSN